MASGRDLDQRCTSVIWVANKHDLPGSSQVIDDTLNEILSVDNGPQGIAVLLRCHCGRRAVWLTGRDRSEVLRHEASPRTEDAA